MRTILVVANETLAGARLLERAQEEAAKGPVRVVLCVPRKNPSRGNVIYADTVYEAAQVRVDLARGVLRERGIDCIGEVGDPDPYSATMDAVAEHHPDHIIVSTFPESTSGWLRRHFVERITEAVQVPVEHIVTDLAEGSPFDITLVVANRTTNSDVLIGELKSMAEAEPSGRERLFIFVVPLEGGEGMAVKRAQARLAQVIDRARAADLQAAGMTGDPDPYTATMNALELFDVDDIVISTYSETRSGWLRADLIERARKSSQKPVKHITQPEDAQATA
ncbi:MAG TPA: universal stress protein [Solirubrobacteraceae bacterium]